MKAIAIFIAFTLIFSGVAYAQNQSNAGMEVPTRAKCLGVEKYDSTSIVEHCLKIIESGTSSIESVNCALFNLYYYKNYEVIVNGVESPHILDMVSSDKLCQEIIYTSYQKLGLCEKGVEFFHKLKDGDNKYPLNSKPVILVYQCADQPRKDTAVISLRSLGPKFRMENPVYTFAHYLEVGLLDSLLEFSEVLLKHDASVFQNCSLLLNNAYAALKLNQPYLSIEWLDRADNECKNSEDFLFFMLEAIQDAGLMSYEPFSIGRTTILKMKQLYPDNLLGKLYLCNLYANDKEFMKAKEIGYQLIESNQYKKEGLRAIFFSDYYLNGDFKKSGYEYLKVAPDDSEVIEILLKEYDKANQVDSAIVYWEMFRANLSGHLNSNEFWVYGSNLYLRTCKIDSALSIFPRIGENTRNLVFFRIIEFHLQALSGNVEFGNEFFKEMEDLDIAGINNELVFEMLITDLIWLSLMNEDPKFVEYILNHEVLNKFHPEEYFLFNSLIKYHLIKDGSKQFVMLKDLNSLVTTGSLRQAIDVLKFDFLIDDSNYFVNALRKTLSTFGNEFYDYWAKSKQKLKPNFFVSTNEPFSVSPFITEGCYYNFNLKMQTPSAHNFGITCMARIRTSEMPNQEKDQLIKAIEFLFGGN